MSSRACDLHVPAMLLVDKESVCEHHVLSRCTIWSQVNCNAKAHSCVLSFYAISLDQDLTLEGPPGRGYKGTYSLFLVSALFVNYSVPGDQTLPPAQRICWIKAEVTHSLVTLDKNLTRNLDHPQSSFMLSDSI